MFELIQIFLRKTQFYICLQLETVMNLSRLAVLAVFFMMVMSAFVAVPAYNVSAEDHNDEDHDHNHGDGSNDMMVCYNSETHEFDPSITNPEDCQGAGLMWTSINSGPNHGDDEPMIQHYDVVLEMEDLSNWLVKMKGTYSVEDSDRQRDYLAQMCENSMEGNSGEITTECYEYILSMENNNDHGNGHGCPPGLSDDDCIAMQECQNGVFNMSCARLMYNYCYENPNMCDD